MMNKLLEKLNSVFRKGKRPAELPAKQTMNLYVRKKDGNSWQIVLPLAVFLAAMIWMIYSFGVKSRLEKLDSLAADNAALRIQLDSKRDQLNDFYEVEDEYHRYTTGYLQPDEIGLVKRERIFEMLQESTEGIGTIKKISIEGNQVGMVVDILSLEDTDLIQDRLSHMKNIDEIMISTAKGTNNVEVEGYIIFTVMEYEDEDGEPLSAMTEAERAARYQAYAQAAKEAREAKQQGLDSSEIEAKAEALYVNTKNADASAAVSSAGTGTQTPAAAIQVPKDSAIPVSPDPQMIGNDTVINDPSQVPPGFDSLSEGMEQLQEAGK